MQIGLSAGHCACCFSLTGSVKYIGVGCENNLHISGQIRRMIDRVDREMRRFGLLTLLQTSV